MEGDDGAAVGVNTQRCVCVVVVEWEVNERVPGVGRGGSSRHTLPGDVLITCHKTSAAACSLGHDKRSL